MCCTTGCGRERKAVVHPALDGGRLVFLIWEAITHKPVPPEKEGMVHFIGLMFFMVLMVFLLFNDLVNIFG